MRETRQLERIQTGVPGLDAVLGGGLFRAGVYIIEGPPGAGKTILANQMCFSRAAAGESAVYYTLLTEAHERLLAFMSGLRFFDESALPDRVNYVSGFKVLEAEGLAGVV